MIFCNPLFMLLTFEGKFLTKKINYIKKNYKNIRKVYLLFN
ncbi:hypothetical protein M153_152000979 [Pseudoloma neurophilia]|uniref:Uncharacterized protein n=1 Tax=Pseudoloma neurophilia TaxID=146866 RepID=A0A0R0M5R5_9MICR|nr:hypothetical protein M153_152000979 [Pseudoloma neurophilia]